MKKKVLFAAAFILLAESAFAQGNGIAGITEATNMVTSYFDPGTKLIYAVGVISASILVWATSHLNAKPSPLHHQPQAILAIDYSKPQKQKVMRNVMKAATLESKFPILSVEHDCIISKDAGIKKDLSFFSRSFERHFNERPYLKHTCYLFLTKTTKEHSRTTSSFNALTRGRYLKNLPLSN